eukprot:TRINITY_DN5273_c0_g1_i1.p1 TRINITY_DN5273_c0_g1~~TRINITY_DN5273_c0_g1_i1.p1  ORF type:complete len:437 (+),score=101.31 TRINITY_DN5273_c0_g1_i1:214-1524(+)
MVFLRSPGLMNTTERMTSMMVLFAMVLMAIFVCEQHCGVTAFEWIPSDPVANRVSEGVDKSVDHLSRLSKTSLSGQATTTMKIDSFGNVILNAAKVQKDLEAELKRIRGGGSRKNVLEQQYVRFPSGEVTDLTSDEWFEFAEKTAPDRVTFRGRRKSGTTWVINMITGLIQLCSTCHGEEAHTVVLRNRVFSLSRKKDAPLFAFSYMMKHGRNAPNGARDRTVFLLRDPRDTLVSLVTSMASRRYPADEQVNGKAKMLDMMAPFEMDHLQAAMENHISRPRNKIFFVTYARLRSPHTYMEELTSLSTFLGVCSLSDESLKEVYDKYDFKKLQKMEASGGLRKEMNNLGGMGVKQTHEIGSTEWANSNAKLRSGTVRGWASSLTEEQQAYVTEMMVKHLDKWHSDCYLNTDDADASNDCIFRHREQLLQGKESKSRW